MLDDLNAARQQVFDVIRPLSEESNRLQQEIEIRKSAIRALGIAKSLLLQDLEAGQKVQSARKYLNELDSFLRAFGAEKRLSSPNVAGEVK